MFLMQVDSFISEEHIEKALNIEPPSKSAYDSFVEKYRRGLESYVPPEKGWRLPNTISKEESLPDERRFTLISSSWIC
jgi:hypothetical protein